MWGVLVVLILLGVPSSGLAEQWKVIKYRDTPVDVDKPYFENLDTTKSSFVRSAWYNARSMYLVIELSEAAYHYYGVDTTTWKTFKSSESFGKSYQVLLKGRFHCRLNPVPTYSG